MTDGGWALLWGSVASCGPGSLPSEDTDWFPHLGREACLSELFGGLKEGDTLAGSVSSASGTDNRVSLPWDEH